MKVYSPEPPLPPIKPLPSKPTKVIGKAEVYESETKMTASSLFVNRNNKQSIRAQFEVPTEQTGEKPKNVQVFYCSLSDKSFNHNNNQKVIITLDDTDTIESKVNFAMALPNPKKENEYNEVTSYQPIPFADFEAMLKANDVKIQFGETVFVLTAEEKNGLRDLQRTLDN